MRREEPIAELAKQVQELQKEVTDVKKKIAEAEKKETSLSNVQTGNISISNSGSGNMDLTLLGGSTRNIMKGESKCFFFQFSTFLKISAPNHAELSLNSGEGKKKLDLRKTKSIM